jgi:formylglycine-generating enzyme required for sulfatase activity
MVGNAEPPPPAKAINKDVSDTISEAIQRSMQIRRTERCKSVSDFKSLLLNFQKLPAQISNPTNVYTSKVSKIKLSARENTIVLSNGMEFMHIPAGKFIMGSSSGGGGDEKPEHTVNIPYDYWMARFPITNEQYYEYAKEKKFSHPVPDWQKKPTHPVENITLVRAIGYSQWLNTLFEKELQAGASICLPTEAEWEKSARGTDRRKYPWGDQFDLDLCNSEENGHGGTTPVDLYTPNGDSPYGCADMSGNVWEWTHSRYAPYPYDPKDGREDEQITWNDSRILRGGACDCGKGWIRCASRRRLNPDGYDKYFGFRVMLSASSPTEITFEQKKPSIEVIKPVVSQFEQSYYGNLVLSNGIEFMRIPAGSFMMGVDADSWDDFHPQHVIDIPYDYWMSRYLITNEQYNDYIKSKWFVNHPVLGWEKKKDHPVVNVSWNMANEYCHWVNNQLKAEFPTGLSLRLPNEAEWEKAARGTGGRLYPWGNRFDETKCNTKESEKGDTTPVTYYFPNGNSPYGCADMAGNVYEWTCSLYKSYPFNMKNTITRLSNNDEIALRGGSYDLDLVAAYSIFRLGMDPIKGWRSCGFRVLLAPTLNRF